MMTRALELASCGIGQVSPGPLVGTVMVDSTGEIVGEGFYLYDQTKHAETIALEQAGDIQGAIRETERALEVDPSDVQAHIDPRSGTPSSIVLPIHEFPDAALRICGQLGLP